jgi:hypothetical protein
MLNRDYKLQAAETKISRCPLLPKPQNASACYVIYNQSTSFQLAAISLHIF